MIGWALGQILVVMCLPQGLGLDALKKKAEDMWTQIVKLETEKYDLEERQKRQDYDVRTVHAADLKADNPWTTYLWNRDISLCQWNEMLTLHFCFDGKQIMSTFYNYVHMRKG